MKEEEKYLTLEDRRDQYFGSRNIFTLTYTPIELTTIVILSISNPITLVRLYILIYLCSF